MSALDDDLEIQQSATFSELDRRARLIAAHLQENGRSGQPVIVAYPSGVEFAAAFLGCLYANVIAVPASLPRLHGSDERMLLIIADCGAGCVLTGSKQQAPVSKHLRDAGLDVQVVDTESLPDSEARWMPVEWRDQDIAFLQYTSGSTRSPRGVMVSHRNIAANLEMIHESLATSADSLSLGWLPLFHDMGLIAGLLEPLYVGYPTMVMSPSTFLQSPLRWLQGISRYRASISGSPNFGYQACIDAVTADELSQLDLSTWKVAGNGAEPVRAATLEQFARTFVPAGFRPEALTPAFGLAEATLMVTVNAPASSPYELVVDETELRAGVIRECPVESLGAKRLVSSGFADHRTRIEIVDPETLETARPGHIGEIWVQNECVAQGYWRKPEESDGLFHAHLEGVDGTFLRTGDLGFLRLGELFVTGRLKDVIVIRGANYYPHDIEHTVELSHPALRIEGGAVIGLDDGGDVRLVAVHEVKRESRHDIDPAVVFDAIRRAVAREHQLSLDGIVLLRPFSLPKTTSGKVQRSECRSALVEGRLAVLHEWWASEVAPAPIDFSGEPLEQPGVLERQLVDWLKRELSLTELSWTTPLMELGIDSLKGVELGTALSKAFDHTFSTTLLIDYPTIEALASLIRTEVLGVAPAPVAVAVPAAETLRAEEILALDEDELDAALLKSIEDVLKSGGHG